MKSWHGWAILAAFVVAWDSLCHDSLSAGFYRAVLHKQKRPIVVAVWFVTSAHLFGRLPKRLDPYAYLGRGFHASA